MATIPYYVALQVTLVANQTGVMSYSVPQNWKMRVKQIIRVTATSTFQVTAIQNNNGINYTNATQTTPIDGTAFAPDFTTTEGPAPLSVPLELEGAQQIQIQLKDTSGSSNTVTFLLVAEVDYP